MATFPCCRTKTSEGALEKKKKKERKKKNGRKSESKTLGVIKVFPKTESKTASWTCGGLSNLTFKARSWSDDPTKTTCTFSDHYHILSHQDELWVLDISFQEQQVFLQIQYHYFSENVRWKNKTGLFWIFHCLSRCWHGVEALQVMVWSIVEPNVTRIWEECFVLLTDQPRARATIRGSQYGMPPIHSWCKFKHNSYIYILPATVDADIPLAFLFCK